MNIIKTIKRRIKRYLEGRDSQLFIVYRAKHKKLIIHQYDTFESRAVKTLQLFSEAYSSIYGKLKHDFSIKINCSDFCKENKRMMAYSTTSNQPNVVAVPDYSFVDWRETGIENYDKCCDEIVIASKDSPIYDKLFWIGNVKTHKTRETLCELSQKDSRILAIGMGWKKDSEGKNMPIGGYVSLPDHTKYKYLIDIQGRGWSGRTKFLMFSGRPLFLVDRKYEEYWYKDILPYVHYIPVKEDLSDLCAQLDWAEANPEKVEEIAKNAQEFAKNNLRTQNAVEYFAKVILEWSESKEQSKISVSDLIQIIKKGIN